MALKLLPEDLSDVPSHLASEYLDTTCPVEIWFVHRNVVSTQQRVLCSVETLRDPPPRVPKPSGPSGSDHEKYACNSR